MSNSYCFSNHVHDSSLEADYCNWLLSRVQANEIVDFDTQHAIRLHVKGKYWKSWKIDFRIHENDGSYTYHEAKGFNPSDDNFKLKLSLAMMEYPERRFYVNKKIVEFTPMKRLRCEGLVKKKPAKSKSKYMKSWNKITKRWDTVKIEKSKKRVKK